MCFFTVQYFLTKQKALLKCDYKKHLMTILLACSSLFRKRALLSKIVSKDEEFKPKVFLLFILRVTKFTCACYYKDI